MDDSAIICDEITASLDEEKKKLFQQIFMKRKQPPLKGKTFVFYFHFY